MVLTSDGIGRRSTRRAERVSESLRRGSGELLARRRRIAALSLGAAGAMGVVSAYQSGVVRGVPDPPLPGVDSERVDAAGEAYAILSTSDAALGIASYGVTLSLAAAGPEERWREQPWLPVALAVKVAADALSGVALTLEQVTKHRALCFWCLLAAVASVAMVPQAIPEARRAWPRLLTGG